MGIPEPSGDDLTVGQIIERIQQNTETQERVVQDFSSVVSTAEALASNPGQLAETELESWLTQVEGQLLDGTQVGQLVRYLVAIIKDPTQASSAMGILSTMVFKALADEAVNLASPIAQRALQAGIKAAQQAIQQFNDAGGPTLLAAAKLTGRERVHAREHGNAGDRYGPQISAAYHRLHRAFDERPSELHGHYSACDRIE